MLNSKQNVQECDATVAEQCSLADYIIISIDKKSLPKSLLKVNFLAFALLKTGYKFTLTFYYYTINYLYLN